MLVEIWMIKAIMMSSQMEMRNMLLETREKADPCYKVTKNLAVLCSCFRVYGKVELVSNETGYLIDKTSEQNVEDMAFSF